MCAQSQHTRVSNNEMVERATEDAVQNDTGDAVQNDAESKSVEMSCPVATDDRRFAWTVCEHILVSYHSVYSCRLLVFDWMMT